MGRGATLSRPSNDLTLPAQLTCARRVFPRACGGRRASFFCVAHASRRAALRRAARRVARRESRPRIRRVSRRVVSRRARTSCSCSCVRALRAHRSCASQRGLRERLQNILARPFKRLTYSEAIVILENEIASGNVTFENSVSWGIDLASEHERYLTESVFKGPIVVTNYPKDIKAFYMKLDPDEKTVSAMDVLVPKIGEIIGGSQREDRLDVLDRRCKEVGLNPEDIWWYRDLRKYGSVPHSGFGLGFERLVMLVTGVENIRDTIPFPRYPGHTEF